MASETGNPFAGGVSGLSIFPPFAGGGTPSFVGDDTPPIGSGSNGANNNQTTGNGNWYFNNNNQTTGNGNWYFGSGNTTNGNGNWYIGSDTAIIGNGNRASGSDNSITGNGNRPTGSGNTITGNRINTSDGEQTILGNGDLYLVKDGSGQVSVVTNSEQTPSDRSYDFSGLDNNTTGGSTSSSDLEELLRQSPFGPLLDVPGVDGPEDIFGNLGGGGTGGGVPTGNPFERWDPLTDGNPFIEGDEPGTNGNPGVGSGNPFGGGENPFGGGENPFGGGENPFGDGENPFGDGENPFGDGENPFGSGSGNPFEGDDLVISISGDGYLLKDDKGQWYLSSDNTIDKDDQLLFGGGNVFEGGSPIGDGNPFEGGNPFGGGSGNPFEGGNPFGGGSGNPFEGGNPFGGGSGNPFGGGGSPFG